MATDLTQPATGTRSPPPAPRTSTRTNSISLVGALVLGPAILLAVLSRNSELWLTVLAMVVLVVAGLLSRLHSFVNIFVFACVLRPLVDLSAQPRTANLSPTEVFGVGVLAVMGGWLVLRRRELAPRLARPLPLALLALVLVQALAAVGSTDPVDGLAGTLRLAAGVAAFLVIDLLLATGRLTLRHVVQLVVTVSAIPLLYPLLGLVGATVSHQKDDVTALKSVFYLSNNFAYFLVPLLVLGVAWALRSSGVTRLVTLVFTAFVAVELVLTETRGAWVAGTLGVLIVCLLLDRRIAALAALVIVLAAVLVPSVSSRLSSLAADPDQPRTESSLAWRFDQWEGLAGSVSSSPVLGGGPGEALRETGKEAHNDYLKAIVDTGIVGLGVYLWFVYAMLAVAWRSYARVRARRKGGLATDPLLLTSLAAVAAYACAIAVAAAGDNLIDNVTFLWSTVPLLAIAQWALTAPDDELAGASA